MLQQRHPLWRQFERDYIRNEPKGWHANIEAYLMMIECVIEFDKWPLDENPLAGIEDDIELVRKLNVRLPDTAGDGRPRTR